MSFITDPLNCTEAWMTYGAMRCESCGGKVIDAEDITIVDGCALCPACVEIYTRPCSVCGEIHHNRTLHVVDGVIYCTECFLESFKLCSHCWGYHPIENVTKTPFGTDICDKCRKDYYKPCSICGEVHYIREMYELYSSNSRRHGEWICDECAGSSDQVWQCSDCKNYFTHNVLHHSVDDEMCVCHDCLRENGFNDGNINHWIAPYGVRNYYYKPTPCFSRTEQDEFPVDDTIYLGYELEVEANEGLLREADRWIDEDEEDPCNEAASWVNQRLGYTYVKHDGSLDCGMEIVSHPATLSYHLSKRDKIGELFSAMISEGWRSHDTSTCGLHVHFSIAAVENKNPFAVHNLLILVNRFWPYMVKFSRRSESQLNHWAKRYLTNRVPYERLKDFVKSDADRRMAVNLMNDSTVEIRIFRGTLNINTFIAALQFVQTLIDKCIDLGSDPDAVQRITWNQLVESDCAELNAYLEARGLLNVDDPSDPIPEPAKRQTLSSNRSFNVGDRVLFRHPGVYTSFYNSDMPFDFTAEGEIVVIRDSDYGVRFDIDHEQLYLHRLGGAIDGLYGQYCLAEDLIPVDYDF